MLNQDKKKKLLGGSMLLNPLQQGVDMYNNAMQQIQQKQGIHTFQPQNIDIQAPQTIAPPQIGQGNIFSPNSSSIPVYDISELMKPKYDPNKPDFQVSPLNPNAEKEWNISKDKSFDNLYTALESAVMKDKDPDDEVTLKYFPEYKDQLDKVHLLYGDIYHNYVDKKGYTKEKIRDIYKQKFPQLFGQSNAELYPERSPATRESIDRQQENFNTAVNNIHDVNDYNYKALSEGGKNMFEYIKKAKALEESVRSKYNVPEGTTVYEILKEYEKSDPEGYKEDFGKILDKDISLSKVDRRVLFGDGQDIDWWGHPFEMMKRGFDKSIMKSEEEHKKYGEKPEFMEKFMNNTIGGVLHGLSKWEKGIGGLQDKPQAYLDSLNSEHDAKYFRNSNRSITEDVLSATVGGTTTAFQAIFPYATAGFNAVGATETGEEVLDGTFGNLSKGIERTLEKTPMIKEQYNKLDEQGKQDLVEGLTMGTVAVIFKGVSKSKMGKKAGAYITEINNARRNALSQGVGEAKFQAWVEKGTANRSPVVEAIGKEGTTKPTLNIVGEKVDSYQPGAKGRVIKAGLKGFKEGLVENIKEIPNRVNERVNPTTADPNLTDQRTVGDKVKSEVNKATKQVKTEVNKATERAKEKTKDVSIKNASQKAGELVKTINDYKNNTVNFAKNGIAVVNTAIAETFKSIKKYGKENIVDPYNKGLGKITSQNQNTLTQQGIKQNQKIPSETISNKQGHNNQIGHNIKTRVLQNANRMNPEDIIEFNTQYKMEYGDWLIERGFTKSAESNIKDISDYVKSVQKTKEDVFGMIEGKYANESVVDMINEVVKRVNDTKSPEVNKYINLAKKYDQEGGLNLAEIESIRKYFSYEIQPKFFKEQNSVANERNENIYMGVKSFLEKTAESNGFTELKNINKEIGAGFSIVKGVLNKMLGSSANNNLGLTDYIILVEAIQNPSKWGYVLGKLALKNEKVQNTILKVVVGKRKNVNNRGVQVERDKIKNIADTKKQEQALQKFIKKYFPENRTKGLPDLGADSDTNTIIAPGKPITQGKGITVRKGGLAEISRIQQKSENKNASKKNSATLSDEQRNSTINNDIITKKSENASNSYKKIDGTEVKYENRTNIANSSFKRRQISNKDKLELTENLKPKVKLLDKVQIGEVEKGKFAEIPAEAFNDNKVRPLELSSEVYEKIYKKHGPFNHNNFIATANMWDYLIKNVNGIEGHINLIKKLPDNGVLLIGAKRQNGAFVVTHFEPTKGVDIIIDTAKRDSAEIITRNGGEFKRKGLAKISKTGQNKSDDYNKENKNLSSNKKTNDTGGSKKETLSGVGGNTSEVSNTTKDVVIQTSGQGGNSGNGNQGKLGSRSKIHDDGNGSGRATKTSQRVNNKKAKEILAEKEFSSNPKDYTAEEVEILRKYEGAGGLTKAGEDTKGVLDQFYTPEKVINSMWDIVEGLNIPGKTTLETSAGTGRFFRKGYKTTGIEIDKTPGTIAKILHPDADVKIMDFQDLFMDFTGKIPTKYTGEKYDVVIGNPPYKKRITPQREFGEEKKIDRFEDYFIKKGIDLLNDDGVLVMIVPSSFLNKPMNYAKEEISKNATLVDAYRLPEGIFPNTQVGTDIVVFKKGTGSEDGLASNEFFEKNSEKILGEVKTRFNRFGKEESYVEGDISLLDNIKLKKEYNPVIQEVVESKYTEKQKEIFYKEARKYKTAEEFVKSRFFTKKDLERYIREKKLAEKRGDTASVKYWDMKIDYFKKGIAYKDISIRIGRFEFGLEWATHKISESMDEITNIARNEHKRLLGTYPIYEKAEIKTDIENDLFYKSREQLEDIRKEANKSIKTTPKKQGLAKITKPAETKKNPTETQGLAKIKTPKKKKAIKKGGNTVIVGEKSDLENKVIASPDAIFNNKTEEYQRLTNVDGYVENIDPETDITNLNYYKGNTQGNNLYFAGNIYEKLEQLELDKDNISKELYNKQKRGLDEIKPIEYSVDDISFDPNDKTLTEMKTNELYTIREYLGGRTIETQKNKTVITAFMNYLSHLSYGSGLTSWEARTYLGNGRLKKEDKNRIITKTKYFFNKFIREELDTETRNKIVDSYNKTYRSYVKPRYADIPLYLKNISSTFKGKKLKLLPGQIEGINAMLSKGSMVIAHGVGHGKTLEGVISTMTALDRGRTKKPLFIVPGPTLNDTWIATIKEIYPTKEIVNLGGLTTKDIKRLKKELGPDPRDWIQEGQVSVITHDGYNNKIDFTRDTKNELYNDLKDVMKKDGSSDRQRESLNEKIETIIETTTRGSVTTKSSILTNGTFDRDFLKSQYHNMEMFSYKEFKDRFIEETKNRGYDNNLSDEKLGEVVDALWDLKPIYIEDLGIDHFTVDEAHNYKNIFEKAEMKKDEEGKALEINRYGDIQGASSKAGRKMYLGTQYIQKNNNNRNVFLLTATPFNNQPIETYNILSLVGRKRLTELGLFNINEFYSKFANFQEDLVAKPSGTDFDYKRVMKSYQNTQELQRLVNEFVDYKGDNETLIKPEKKLKKITLEMSPLQRDIQNKLEVIVGENREKGDVIMGQGQMRLNLISPYITKYYDGPAPTPKEFIENSPKLDYATRVIKELRSEGKEDGVFIYMPFGTDFHEILKTGISEVAGVPIEKIGVINGKTSKDKKDKIADKYRNGEINILIGGTNTVEGIDLQKNGYITINTLLGWNPTERTQLNGRQRRQGNLRSEVLEILPLLENSADIIMMQKSEEKESRINNIFEYQGKVFDIEEINPMEEKLALLTDPEKKARVWENIRKRKLENDKQNLIVSKETYHRMIEAQTYISKIEPLEKQIEKAKELEKEYVIPTLKKELTEAKRKKKRYNEKMERFNIEDPKKEIERIEKEIEEIEGLLSGLEEEKPRIIEKYRKEQIEARKNKKSMEERIQDIKKDFKELKYFESIDEQKENLEKKRGLSKLSK